MKTIKKCVMVLMSLLPISSVAMAAESVLLSLEGEMQTEGLENWRLSRMAVMPIGTLSISMEDARSHFARQNEFNGTEPSETAFQSHLDVLIREGIIETDETMIRSAIPSIQ